jgi:predicted Zn-dependent peptidase
MMRSVRRFVLFGVSLAFVVAAVTAQQAAPALQKGGAPSTDQKNGTGIVPLGVTLVPQMPEAGAAKPFLFPKAAAKTLPNGLRVFVVSDSREPAVTVRLVIPSAGSILDPAGKPGVAQMAASLLTQGTTKRSAREIAETIDFVGGSLNANVGKDATAITLDVVKKDLNTGLDLLSDVVLHPAFREDEVERQRQQLLSGLTVQYSDPDYLASLVLGRVVYGNSAYGWPAEGTPATVKALQREDFVRFHDRNYAPNQALLGFAGDIAPEAAFAVAEKYFGAWSKSDAVDALAKSAATAPAVSGRHIWLIDKPGAVQTQIRVGKISVRRGDPDYLPLELTNHIFGGGYNSRLNTEVRVKKGLTYDAFSTFAPHRYAGSLTVGTYTRTEATVEVTKLVLDLLDKMASGDVTQKELDFARDYLSGVYPIQSETAEQVDDRVLTAAVFDLPEDYNRTYPEKVRAITLPQVEEMARRYFSSKDVDIVLAGDASAFREALKKKFPDAQVTELRFDEVDVLSPDLREPKKVAAAMTPESAQRGAEILLAAANAAGGEKLASIKTLEINENGKLSYPQGDAPLKVKWMVSYPDRSHGDVNLADQEIVQVCDGSSSWLQFAQGVRDTTPVISEFKRGISLFGGGWGLYQQVLAGKLTGQFIGETEIDGKKTLGVAVEGPFGKLKLYFYPDTHLLAAARFQSAGERGATDNEQRWSDYRSVEGTLFAFSTVTYRDGVKFFESAVQDVQLNPKVDESLFAKPQPAAPAAPK